MKKIVLIGIGAGDPDQMTLQAIEALRTLDVLFMPDKGAEKSGLRTLREALCARFIDHDRVRTITYAVPQRSEAIADYRTRVAMWHETLADQFQMMIEQGLTENQSGGFLVWGDPSLYDSTIRILDTLKARGTSFLLEVIPGITSVQALAAAHRIALNGVGETVTLTPARRLAELFPESAETAVVMLDTGATLRARAQDGLDIFWGANLGTDHQALVSGKLSEVIDTIEAARARIKAACGWVMDIYLLRRQEKPAPSPEKSACP